MLAVKEKEIDIDVVSQSKFKRSASQPRNAKQSETISQNSRLAASGVVNVADMFK